MNFEKVGRLLLPTSEDWLLAGKVIYSLQHLRQSKKTGHISRITPEEKYRLTNDVLIVRTAKRAGVWIVTYNVRDFEKIQLYCDAKLMPATDYFASRIV